MANTFEAFVGALFVDQGYAAAEKFVGEKLFGMIPEIMKTGKWMDAKSLFQEKAQEIAGVTPAYKTLKEEGPDHNKSFTVGVFLDKDMVARGSGKSKQEAEQKAAEEGLKTRKWN